MNRVPQQKIDEILSAADIVSYVSRYVSLKRTGKNLKGLCPFHKEKTPSFTVSPEKQLYHCFGCGKGGNLVGFLMEIEKLSYIEAIRRIAADVGIALPRIEERKQSGLDRLLNINSQVKDLYKAELHKTNRSFANEYLKKRRLKTTTIDLFELGFAPNSWDFLLKKSLPKDQLSELGLVQARENKPGMYDKFRNRLIFPFHDTNGRIVGFGGRALQADQQPKYLNSPESPVYKKNSILYGLFQAAESIRREKMAILVEGYFDMLRLVDSGIRNVIASSGTALSKNQALLLKRYTNQVIIAYDSDQAGIRAAQRNAIVMESADLDVEVLVIPAPHDPDSYILEHGVQKFKKLLQQRQQTIQFRLLEFKKSPDHHSMQKQKEFIDEILADLTEIPNEVKIGLYIHRISEVLEVPESLLISQYNRLKRRTSNFGLAESEKDEKNIYRQVRHGQWRAEETLLAILLENDSSINKQILNQVSTADFVNEDLRELFDQIAHIWEEDGDVDVQVLQNSYKNLNQILSGLKLIDISNQKKMAADCIYQVRKWALNTRFNEVKRLINEEASSEKSVMHYMKELSDIRRKLTEIEHERNKYQKKLL